MAGLMPYWFYKRFRFAKKRNHKELTMKKLIALTALATSVLLLSACTPEIGSDEWCADLKEKPKGEWTGNEVADYAKHCVFK